jgi:hypothetical protein
MHFKLRGVFSQPVLLITLCKIRHWGGNLRGEQRLHLLHRPWWLIRILGKVIRHRLRNRNQPLENQKHPTDRKARQIFSIVISPAFLNIKSSPCCLNSDAPPHFKFYPALHVNLISPPFPLCLR